MINSNIGGKLVSDLILNKKNNYISLFNPNRGTNIIKIKNNLINIYNNINGYVLGKLVKDKSFYKDVKIVKIDNKYYGIYKDQKVSLVCPHMGCELVFNEFNKTWECPCHGSRFDLKGNIINGPSKKNIKKSN